MSTPVAASSLPRLVTQKRIGADVAYRALATGAGLLTLIVLGLIGLFLLWHAWPALRLAGPAFLTTTKWQPDGAAHQFGIAALMYWTVAIAAIALAIAVPISVACALFIYEYAPRALARPLTGLVDLLAAIPSVIYGIWGLFFLEPNLVATSSWLTSNLGFVPILQTTGPNYAGSAFMAGLVVALMITPILTSVIREVFSETPVAEKEAALALGSSRWGMIRTVVLPFGQGGIIGGTMLGLGRALGETIAVALIISPTTLISIHLLQSGANSVAATIALQFGESSQQYGIPALMAAGVALFAITLVVNSLASLIVQRSRSGRGVEI